MIYWTKIEILEIARRYLHQQLHHHHHHRLQSLPSYRLCTFTAMHRSGDYLIFVPQTKRVGTYASSAAASDAAVTWTQFTFHGSLERVLVFLFDHRRESEIGNLAVAACYYSEMARQ
jgi:hypothetical protein